ncbi:galectin-1-like [Eublepharis macularius]|uniref:Galectin n=1 Tax=Eublepharis macularius TaxID=481883 RepID=A0AA97KUJ5_EUBMA|nr:galectin-1-like [Eublepharis macularius]XP_054830478.1 galectin-1-like [Eublepharis macularius]XP_054830481.1 galectin-1-like [Eublepharis macularius]
MAKELIISNLKKLHVDDSITVQGRVAPGAKRFAINLGKDYLTSLIHFNPRFTEGLIVYNSRKDGGWDHFHHKSRRSESEYPDGKVFDFKSPLKLNHIDYIKVDDDFEVHSIDIE